MKILMSLCNKWLNDNLDKVLYLTPDLDDGSLVNVDVTASTDITSSELDAMLLQTANTAYARSRASIYPSIQEQLDMQYWDGVNGTTIWADTVASVKSENPKP